MIESNSGAITIEAEGELTLKAPQIAIEATGTLDVKASGNADAQGRWSSIN